ncbi:MAG TPA: magnesium transporter CorA family protein [Candidatus Dormibacteraeota bacterium]
MRYLVSAAGLIEDPEEEQIQSCVADQSGGVFWVHIEEPREYDIDLLRRTFNFHALTIEELRKRSRGQRIEDYPSYAFLVLQRPVWRGGQLFTEEVEVFLSRHYVVTVFMHSDPGLASLRKRLLAAPELAREKPAFLQFLVLDQLVENSFSVLEALERAINHLERQVITNPTRRQLGQAYDMRQTVTDLEKNLGGMEEVFQHLITHSIDPQDAQLLIYYRDIFGHIQRQHESARELSDLAHSVMEVYMAGADNRLNATMKQLTMLAALFLPVTAISGFFGMNHQFLVEHITSDVSFWLTLALMVATQAVLAVFFWRRGYF